MTCWAGESVDSKRKSVQVRVFLINLIISEFRPTGLRTTNRLGPIYQLIGLKYGSRVKASPLKKGGQRNFCTTAGGDVFIASHYMFFVVAMGF